MNKRILVFLIIILMLISTASAGFFSELFTGDLGEMITGKAISTQKGTCTDTDITAAYPDGKNTYVKGTASGTSTLGYPASHTDACVSNPKLIKEAFCEEYGEQGGEYVPKTQVINCPSGTECSDGKCITTGTPDTTPDTTGTPDTSYTLTPPTTPGVLIIESKKTGIAGEFYENTAEGEYFEETGGTNKFNFYDKLYRIRFRLYAGKDNPEGKIMVYGFPTQELANVKVNNEPAKEMYKVTDFSILKTNEWIEVWTIFNPDNFYMCFSDNTCKKADGSGTNNICTKVEHPSNHGEYTTKCIIDNTKIPRYFISTITPTQKPTPPENTGWTNINEMTNEFTTTEYYSAPNSIKSTRTGTTGKGGIGRNLGNLAPGTYKYSGYYKCPAEFGTFKNYLRDAGDVIWSGGTQFEKQLVCNGAWTQFSIDMTVTNNAKNEFIWLASYLQQDEYVYFDELKIESTSTTPPATRSWTRSWDAIPIPTVTPPTYTPPPTECVIGCELEEACLPIGHRATISAIPSYCGLTATGTDWIEQKTGEEICDNAYECDSYQCLAGTCVDMSSVKRERSFVRNLFCKLAVWVKYKGWDTEDKCHNYLDKACDSDTDCTAPEICHSEDKYCVECQYHSNCDDGVSCYGDKCTPCNALGQDNSLFCAIYYAESEDYKDLRTAGWETRISPGDEYKYCYSGKCIASCNSHSQCEELDTAKPYCVGGNCQETLTGTPQPECTTNNECSGTKPICGTNGNCRACQANECPTGKICDSTGACVTPPAPECASNNDCLDNPKGRACDLTTKQCGCTIAYDCRALQNANICDTSQKICVECLTHSTCYQKSVSKPICDNYICTGCKTHAECDDIVNNGICIMSGYWKGACFSQDNIPPEPTACITHTDCGVGNNRPICGDDNYCRPCETADECTEKNPDYPICTESGDCGRP